MSDSQRDIRGSAAIRWIFTLSFVGFIVSTLFDPADLALGLKVPLYAVTWLAGVTLCITRRDRVRFPPPLVIYVLLMVGIPLASLAWYFLVDARAPFAGFQLYKAYVFISVAILLYMTRTDLMPFLAGALTLLALMILATALVVLLVPALKLPLYVFGNQFGIFSIDSRDYGSGLVLFQMYFVTSPMLALSVAYYFDRWRNEPGHRVRHGLLTLTSLVALVVAGTRNNILGAVLVIAGVLVVHYRRKPLVIATLGVALIGGAAALSGQIGILLDPTEVSNSVKLALVRDYGRILGDPVTLLFGRGLGAYEHWSRGDLFISELTYLEIVRNFGLIGGAIMIGLLIYPVVHGFILRRRSRSQSVLVGYSAYLLMCISNPNLFSSMGMLILGVILANLFQEDAERRTSWRARAPREGGMAPSPS
jgi:hypothetical protein